MAFKTLDFRQCRIAIPERRETKKVSPTFASVYCLERVSRYTERGNPGGAQQIP